MKHRRKKVQPGEDGPADFSPVSWRADSHPEYANHMKKAKRAGRKHPDPSKSTTPPSCFDALRHQTVDQIHHEIGVVLDEIRPHRVTLAANHGVEQRLAAKQDLSEQDERLLRQVRTGREEIRHALDRGKSRLGSIQQVYNGTLAAMQEEFRGTWVHRAHFDALVFPELNLETIRYQVEIAGLSLADFLPQVTLSVPATTQLRRTRGELSR